ncbi:MAG: glucuronate isomerase [Sphaerochaetaceae bacterium]|nr:glucuronate isomerase [Sphaerochaetaceae bacterium]NLO59935.1 glucuronate isomerase [Spirochaetales bacterium]MDD2405509.1 glucuronate isomerase [Sphaerochaetaceae bacterium]MDD3671087.1 glucuronate isomerase [Sphaerochaetaceae bacterium]MDD4258944.1 glucuronate isomerase [Sphaerochaetaceae bacterium]
MRTFMDENFLLQNPTAVKLYHDYAKEEPIFDYHCHLSPSQIAQDKRFSNLTEIWLGGDHYKWRAMRTVGIDEKLITGNASPFDKFMAWAQTIPQLLGNPLYHWSHLELQRYFGIHEVLNTSSAFSIWEQANEILASDSMSIPSIFSRFKVAAVGTTDDPIDDLAYHKQIAQGSAVIGTIETKVLPSYRPDKALMIQAKTFPEYIKSLGSAAAITIKNVNDVIEALAKRLQYFISNGCKASDHGVPMVPYTVASDKEIDEIFAKALEGKPLTTLETDAYQTKVMLALGELYAQKGIVMQLHLNSIRNLNPPMFDQIGPDTGFDATHDAALSDRLAFFLGALEKQHSMPKTILYSLNPNDYYVLATHMGSYQGGGIPGKMQLGSGWWFCDHKDGMEEQMRTLGNLGSLPRFVGMLTDSRSFLSYPRHEYFRRILCNLFGKWAEHGEVPADIDLLGSVVKDISYRNAQAYFG